METFSWMVENCEQHTSHVTFSCWMTRTRVTQVVSMTCVFHTPRIISMRSCYVFDSLRLLHFLLFAVCLLSYRFFFYLSDVQLYLSWCEGRISYELSPMRILAPLSSTILSQFMSPTTTTSRRPLNRTSRNLPTRTGPWIRMTSSAMTSPLALRSLHHCSPRSPKLSRAVDELITLLTKVCRPVSRRLSVMERGNPLWISFTHKLQKSERICATAQKMSKSGFFCNDKKDRFSLTVKQRFEHTSSSSILTEEVFKSWRKLSSFNEKKFIVLIKETNDFAEINNFFMNNYWQRKSGSLWSLWEKSQWDGRIEEISRL